MSIEIQVKRESYSGNLDAPPSIDELDELRRKADAHGAAFASLAMPALFTESDEANGDEISLINSWVDLAAYLEMSLLRLIVAPGSDIARSTVSSAFRHALDYAFDQDFDIGLSNQSGPPRSLAPFLDHAPRESGAVRGLDIPLDTESIEAENSETRILCVHTAIGAAHPQDEIDRARTQWRRFPHAHLIVDMKA